MCLRLGEAESRGSHFTCVFSVRTSLWLDGGVAVLSGLERSDGHGHKVSRFLRRLPVGYNHFLHLLAPATPTRMPGRVPVRSWWTRVCT